MRTIPDELIERYRARGWWTGETIGELLDRGLAAAPGAVFRVHSEVRPWSGTFADVELEARRLAAGLRDRGVGPGDVVVFQLPNWKEAAVVFWGASLLGCTVVPVVHIYGHKELRYILEAVRPKVFVAPERFGRREHEPEVSVGVPIVGVVGRDFEDLYAEAPMAGVVRVDPATPSLIAFTSGTTSDPKGVVHSHDTLGFEARQLSARMPPHPGPMITFAPVGHFIGMLYAFLIPVLDGTAVHLTDSWNPLQIMDLMRQGLVMAGGTTFHVTSIIDHPDFGPDLLPSMRFQGMGAGTVPSEVTSRLAAMGVTVFRSYGSTEHPSITGSPWTAPETKRLHTDGVPLEGVEIRLDEDGEIVSRGPDLCLGYTDDALTRKAFDADGWYRTGDMGVIDADGYLSIVDRKSDIIIRGGENISALELEEVLLGAPGVAEAVVVAAPDERMGEHAAAVLRMLPGRPAPSLDEVRSLFAEAGLARQKWPESVHVVDDLPRTATGKVQKFRVRALVADGLV